MILNITNYYAYLDYDFAKKVAIELKEELAHTTVISDWQCDVKSRVQGNETVHHAYAYSIGADVRVYLSRDRMYCACGGSVSYYSDTPYFEVTSESPSQAFNFFWGRQPYLAKSKEGQENLPTTEQAIKAYITLIWPWAVTARIVDGDLYVYSEEPDYISEWRTWHRKYGSNIKIVSKLAKVLHLDNLTEEEEKNWRMDF